MREKGVDARLDDRAAGLRDDREKIGELLKLGRLLGGDLCPLVLGVELSDGAEGEHVVAVHLVLIGESPAEVVPTGSATGSSRRQLVTRPVFEDGEVLDPLGARAHEGLADVAEARGLGEHAGLVALEDRGDDLDDGRHGLIDGLVGERGDVGLGFQFLGFCHDFLQ